MKVGDIETIIRIAVDNRCHELVMTALHLASKYHEIGGFTDAEMISLLEQGINATAQLNGYADRFGEPIDRARAHKPGRKP